MYVVALDYDTAILLRPTEFEFEFDPSAFDFSCLVLPLYYICMQSTSCTHELKTYIYLFMN